MNTFLPYPDFRESAQVLDNRRLGKQRVETLQLARAIAWEQSRFRSHPAAIMWQPYLDSLIHYGLVVCEVWREKGFRDTVWDSLYKMLEGKEVVHPHWLGDERFHSAHRSNLLRKDPVFYGKYGWKESTNLPYYWPTNVSQ